MRQQNSFSECMKEDLFHTWNIRTIFIITLLIKYTLNIQFLCYTCWIVYIVKEAVKMVSEKKYGTGTWILVLYVLQLKQTLLEQRNLNAHSATLKNSFIISTNQLVTCQISITAESRCWRVGPANIWCWCCSQCKLTMIHSLHVSTSPTVHLHKNW